MIYECILYNIIRPNAKFKFIRIWMESEKLAEVSEFNSSLTLWQFLWLKYIKLPQTFNYKTVWKVLDWSSSSADARIRKVNTQIIHSFSNTEHGSCSINRFLFSISRKIRFLFKLVRRWVTRSCSTMDDQYNHQYSHECHILSFPVISFKIWRARVLSKPSSSAVIVNSYPYPYMVRKLWKNILYFIQLSFVLRCTAS